MAIVNATIKSQVTALINSLNTGNVTEKDPAQIQDEFAQGIADIIETAIKSADVTIPIGVVSVGTSPSVVPNPAPIPLTTPLS